MSTFSYSWMTWPFSNNSESGATRDIDSSQGDDTNESDDSFVGADARSLLQTDEDIERQMHGLDIDTQSRSKSPVSSSSSVPASPTLEYRRIYYSEEEDSLAVIDNSSNPNILESGFDSSPTSEDTATVGNDHIGEQPDTVHLAKKLEANDPESLSAGIIRTTKDRTELTILLVGETGVGKTSFLSLLANILDGRRPEEFVQVHLQANESGGSHAGSQTQKATVYEFQSRNGILVRIMDTPGLADTRGLAMDELNKKSIAEAIQHHITSIHAVIILANGTLARLGIATDYALTTLSAIFPRSLEKNISFLFTNVNNPLQWNFQEDTIPQFLRDAERFTLDNPFSMEMRLRALCEMPQKAAFVKRMRAAVSNTYTETIDELTLLFNWMNELEPQPTKEILTLYQQVQEIEMRIGDALASMEQDSTKRKQVERIQAVVAKHGVSMKTYQAYEKVISRPVWSQIETQRHNTLCTAPGCYSNCHESCKLDFSLDPKAMYACGAMRHSSQCKRCSHAPEQHRHFNSLWERKNEEQITVDEDARTQYTAAKSKKEQQELILEEMKTQCGKFSARIKDQTEEIGRLAEEYSKISLSGNMSAQVEKALRMLEMHQETMRGNGTDAETLSAMDVNLKMVRDKLNLLRKATSERAASVTNQLVGYLSLKGPWR